MQNNIKRYKRARPKKIKEPNIYIKKIQNSNKGKKYKKAKPRKIKEPNMKIQKMAKDKKMNNKKSH